MAARKKRARSSTRSWSNDIDSSGEETRNHEKRHQTSEENSPAPSVTEVSSRRVNSSPPRSKVAKPKPSIPPSTKACTQEGTIGSKSRLTKADLLQLNAVLERENDTMKSSLEKLSERNKNMAKRNEDMETFHRKEHKEQLTRIQELEADAWGIGDYQDQTCDGVLIERMRVLASDIQNFVLNTFRNHQLGKCFVMLPGQNFTSQRTPGRNVSQSPVSDELLGAIPRFGQLKEPNKFLIAQAVVVAQLMRILQDGGCKEVPFDSVLKRGYALVEHLNESTFHNMQHS